MSLNSKAGITADDVAGRRIHGLGQVVLTDVRVTEERLVADFVFGEKKTPGEIAAFHTGSGEAPVLALTFDRLALGELLPGAAGRTIDGVELKDLTFVIVPPGAPALRPDDPAMPAHVADNLKRVIADAAKHDRERSTHTLAPGFNLLADLDLGRCGAYSLSDGLGRAQRDR